MLNIAVLTVDTGNSAPRAFSLSQNYPNPFNAITDIEFSLPAQADVRLEIFNMLGQKVATMVDGVLPAGYHTASWNATNEASGVYFYRLTAGGLAKTNQMTLLK
jgi:hypothetical protein